jgi:hypothetical protein
MGAVGVGLSVPGLLSTGVESGSLRALVPVNTGREPTRDTTEIGDKTSDKLIQVDEAAGGTATRINVGMDEPT